MKTDQLTLHLLQQTSQRLTIRDNILGGPNNMHIEHLERISQKVNKKEKIHIVFCYIGSNNQNQSGISISIKIEEGRDQEHRIINKGIQQNINLHMFQIQSQVNSADQLENRNIKIVYAQLPFQDFKKIHFEVKEFELNYCHSVLSCLNFLQRRIKIDNYLQEGNYIFQNNFLLITKYQNPQSSDRLKMFVQLIIPTVDLIQLLIVAAKQQNNPAKYYQIYQNWNKLHLKMINIDYSTEKFKQLVKRQINQRQKDNKQFNLEQFKILLFLLCKLFGYHYTNQLILKAQVMNNFVKFNSEELQNGYAFKFIQKDHKFFLFYTKFYLFSLINHKQQYRLLLIELLSRSNLQYENQLKYEMILQLNDRYHEDFLRFKVEITQHLMNNKICSFQMFIKIIIQHIYQYFDNKVDKFNQIIKILRRKSVLVPIINNQIVKQYVKLIFQNKNGFRFQKEDFIKIIKQAQMAVIQVQDDISRQIEYYLHQKLNDENENIFIQHLKMNKITGQIKDNYFLMVIKLMLHEQWPQPFKKKFKLLIELFLSKNISVYIKYMMDIQTKIVQDQNLRIDLNMHYQIINNIFTIIISQINIYYLQEILKTYFKFNKKPQNFNKTGMWIQIVEKKFVNLQIKQQEVVLLILNNYSEIIKSSTIEKTLLAAIYRYIHKNQSYNSFYIYKLIAQSDKLKQKLIDCERVINLYYKYLQMRPQFEFNQAKDIFINHPSIYMFYRMSFQQEVIQKQQKEMFNRIFLPKCHLPLQLKQTILKNQNIYKNTDRLWQKLEKPFNILKMMDKIQNYISNLYKIINIYKDYISLNAQTLKYETNMKKIQQFNLSLEQFNEKHFNKNEIFIINKQQKYKQYYQLIFWKQIQQKNTINNIQQLIKLYKQFKRLSFQKIKLLFDKEALCQFQFKQFNKKSFYQLLKYKGNQQALGLMVEFNEMIQKMPTFLEVVRIYLQFIDHFKFCHQIQVEKTKQNQFSLYHQNNIKKLNLYKIKQFIKLIKENLLKILQQNSFQAINIFLLRVSIILKNIKFSAKFNCLRLQIQNKKSIFNLPYLKGLQINRQQDPNNDFDIKHLKLFTKMFTFITTLKSFKKFQDLLKFFKKQVLTFREEEFQNDIAISQTIAEEIIQFGGYLQNTPTSTMVANVLLDSIYQIKYQNQILTQKIIKQKQTKKKLFHIQYTYEKLLEIKESVLLEISDLNANNQQFYENYKKYIQFVDEYVVCIHSSLAKLIQEGFDINSIKHSFKGIELKDRDLRQLKIIKDKLYKIQQKWSAKIIQIYKNSFICTHFVGNKFKQFITKIYQKKINPTLAYIMQRNQKQLIFQIKNQSDDYFDKVDKFLTIIKKLQISRIIQQKQHNKNKLEIKYLLLIKQKDILYILAQILRNNRNLFINRIFFCQEHTTQLEIFCFLYRSILDNGNTYFLINPSKLNDKNKYMFVNQLNYISIQRHIKYFQIQIIDTQRDSIVYKYLSQQQKVKLIQEPYNIEELRSRKNVINHVQIVESTSVGLGKTFYIEQQAKKYNKRIKYFPIAGKINFLRLKKRLQNLNLMQKDILLLQIGYIEDIDMLNIFLIQMIFFKGLYLDEYYILPQDIQIYIQVQAFQKNRKDLIDNHIVLDYFRLLKKTKKIESFKIEVIVFSNTKQQLFVFHYLNLNKTKEIGNKELQFSSQLPNMNDQIKRQLIKQYFYDPIVKKKKQPNYFQYHCFHKILFNYFKAFSNFPLVKKEFYPDNQNNLPTIRLQFIKTFIQNCQLMIEQTVFISNFTLQNTSPSQNLLSSQNLNKLLILTRQNQKQFFFQFAYLDCNNIIPSQIKKMFVLQNPKNRILNQNSNDATIDQAFKKTALTKLSANQLIQKLKQFSPNPSEEIHNDKNYVITLDNFYKMCFIIQKSRCDLPIVIMGQSGVGKTALIQFLVIKIFKEELIKIDVHAGIQQEELEKYYIDIKKKALSNINKKVWVFFDQFNTTICLSYIKQIIMDRRFLGQNISPNIIFIAACNPYRFKQQSQHRIAGLQKLQQSLLAFLVKPPPLSLLQLMWDYDQLKPNELRKYITSMLINIKYSKKDKLIQTLLFVHNFFIKKRQVSSVSLRDVYRFNKLYQWFLLNMPHERRDSNKINTNYSIDRPQRATILSFMFCYSYKFSTNKQRKQFINQIQNKMGYLKGYMNQILQIQQEDYVSRLTKPDIKIVFNKAIRQNIFTAIVCIANKIPLLIIGSPGSSKSLSIALLQNNLEQKYIESQQLDQFLSRFPQIQILYYQGSIASTSQSIIQKYQAAKKYISYAQKRNKQDKLFPCIIFDEIGLAERSKYNPLKVLHSKLETNSTDVCFISTSNFELDLAKMTRCLTLYRSPPDQDDNIETVSKFYQLYKGSHNERFPLNFKFANKTINNFRQLFKQIGINYTKFIQSWNKQYKKDFFGLRDFYSYLKHICRQFESRQFVLTSYNIINIISEAISINFDGQQHSVRKFHQLCNIPYVMVGKMNYYQMILKNLQYPDSRSILLIGDVECFVQFLAKKLHIKGMLRKINYLYGSIFEQDQNSEAYPLKTVASILNHLSYGTILGYININQNIQTSLYDVFNKNYFNNHCKVSVGTKTKQVFVHDNYNSIVFLNKSLVQNINPAFLNRFQKHQINLDQLLSQEQRQIFKEIDKWLKEMLSFLNQNRKIKLKKQNLIYNISKQAIQSLIIKNEDEKMNKSELVIKLKRDILKNATLDMQIAMERYEQINIRCQFSKIRRQIMPYQKCQKDLIILTYNYNLIKNQGISNIQLKAFKNENQLKQKIKQQIKNQRTKIIQISIDAQKQYYSIYYILFLINQFKSAQQISKQFRIVIFMNRYSLLVQNKENLIINHLQNYQQYFVEDMRSQDNNTIFQNIISQHKNIYQIIQIIHLEVNNQYIFQNVFQNVSRTIKFSFKNNIHSSEESSLSFIYFKGLIQLFKDQKFKNIIKWHMKELLISKRCKLQKILEFQVKIASNFKEAIKFYVLNEITNIIIIIINFMIENEYFFVFSKSKTFIFQQIAQLQQRNEIQLMRRYEEYYCQYPQLQYLNSIEERINNFMKELIKYNENEKTKQIDDNNLDENQFLIKNNTILIRQYTSIIPQIYKSITYIYSHDKIVDSLERMINNSRDINQFCNRVDKYSSNILSQNIQKTIFLSQLQRCQLLQYLFLFDLINYFLRKFYYPRHTVKNNNSSQSLSLHPNLKLKRNIQILYIFNHFQLILRKLPLKHKLIFFTYNREQLIQYIDLLFLLQLQKLGQLGDIIKIEPKIFQQNQFDILNYLIMIVFQQIYKQLTEKKPSQNKYCSSFENFKDFMLNQDK